MKTKKLSDYTTEELNKKHKSAKGALIGFLIIWAVIIVGLIILYLNTNNIKMATLTPIFILPITLLPIFINYNNLSKELKSREDHPNE